MEEIEIPTEHLHEQLNESAHENAERWILMVALTAALLAVLAAITALLAGHYANEAMIEQIQASDQWSYYQAKGIKSAVLESKIDLLKTLGKEANRKKKRKPPNTRMIRKRLIKRQGKKRPYRKNIFVA